MQESLTAILICLLCNGLFQDIGSLTLTTAYHIFIIIVVIGNVIKKFLEY